MTSHLQSSPALAHGIHSVRLAEPSVAVTAGAHRFLKNRHVTLQTLVEPLLAEARRQSPTACDRYLLVVHDWSQLMYPKHASKKDRVKLSSRRVPEGYELQTALLVSDRDGLPLAPGVLSLRAADGVHCSRGLGRVRKPLSPLDELAPTMAYLEQQALGKPLVHIIDAEADSVGHFREWSEVAGRHYLVRADDRLVEYEGVERRCSEIAEQLREAGAFRHARPVLYHGKHAEQYVAEASVILKRPAQRNRPAQGDRRRIYGPPLTLRLVVGEVRDSSGASLAVWYLLTNLPADVEAQQAVLWYYWRWSIESYFKLLKSAGLQVEEWQQHTADAITKRLLVASMACVTVWRLAHNTHPQATEARTLLARLSGRQMKQKQSFTLPILLDGLHILLAMLAALEQYTPQELITLAQLVLPKLQQPP